MFQLFHADVVKVDRDVAYVAMVVHVCCKRLFLMFHLFFQMYVGSVFIWMLHMFNSYVASIYLDVAYVLQWLLSVSCVCFLSVSDACFKHFYLCSYVCCKRCI